jgi:small multidrug resistance pump
MGQADGEYSSMGYVFLVLALTLNALANVLLKVGAMRLGPLGEPDLIARLVANRQLLAGLALFALNVVFYVLALTRLNLSVAYPIMVAGGVLIVVSVSIFFLHEAVSGRQMLGLLLLILGIVLVAERSIT